MIVGVTGGAGFIGKHVCDELRARGHRPVVFDHLGRCGDQVMLGDVRDATAVFELAANVDGIIHLAAVLGTQETIQAPRPSAETNIVGSLHVFEAAGRYGLPVAYAGVGNHWMRTHGTGSYTISKSAAEDYARMFNAYRGGRIAIVRPVNAYGPRQSVAAPYGPSKVRKVIPAFTCRALTGAPIEVYGDGTQVSDCVWVGDVAKAFVTALEATQTGSAPAKPVEVGPAESLTVNEVAALVAQASADVTGADPAEVKHIPMRPGEVPNAVVNADVATLGQIGMDAADFKPLDEGIAETVRWFADHWLPGYTAQSR